MDNIGPEIILKLLYILLRSFAHVKAQKSEVRSEKHWQVRLDFFYIATEHIHRIVAAEGQICILCVCVCVPSKCTKNNGKVLSWSKIEIDQFFVVKVHESSLH